MLTDYIQATMKQATYRVLDNDEGIWGEVTELEGTWVCEPTYPRCRQALQSVIEDWILVKLKLGQFLPALDGIGYSSSTSCRFQTVLQLKNLPLE